jgi:ABC-2 type transport system permease protein
MRNIWVLTKKELAIYFYSPLAYVIITAFLLLSGYFFYQFVAGIADATALRYVLEFIGFISLIISPMITMRLLAEEKKSGTLELLMTAPITETQVVVSKYISSLLFFIALIMPTVAYVILLIFWGKPDLGAIICGYLGLICLAGVFLSIGLFVSSFTSNQIVAVIITFVILLIGWVIGWAGEFFREQWWKDIFKYIGFFEHFDAFRKGLIDSRDFLYCFSLIIFFLFLTVRIVESRRWK